jgi:hypothetical protein
MMNDITATFNDRLVRSQAPRRRRAAAWLWGLTARCDQADSRTVPLMPRFRMHEAKIHRYRNLLHEASDTPRMAVAR